MNKLPEIQPADPGTRRTLVASVVLLLVLVILLQPMFAGFEAWLASDSGSIEDKLSIVSLVIALAFAPLLLLGIYVWRMGQQVLVAGRFPAPRMKVIVDTPIVEGSRAVLRGWLLKGAGLLLGVVAVGFPLAFWWILRQMAGVA